MEIDNSKYANFDEDHPVIKTFNNWADVNDWWCKNPTAVRVSPDIQAKTLEEYNNKNHALKFPCEMQFIFPLNEN